MSIIKLRPPNSLSTIYIRVFPVHTLYPLPLKAIHDDYSVSKNTFINSSSLKTTLCYLLLAGTGKAVPQTHTMPGLQRYDYGSRNAS